MILKDANKIKTVFLTFLTIFFVLLFCSQCMAIFRRFYFNGYKMYLNSRRPYNEKVYFDYYLTPDNTVLTCEAYKKLATSHGCYDGFEFYGIGEFYNELYGGGFIVFVKGEDFPVKGARIDNLVKLALQPYYKDKNESMNSFNKEIKKRRKLFNDIANMYMTKKGRVKVVIELCEDIGLMEITERNPLKLEMENANAFFATDRNGRLVFDVNDIY